MTVLVVGASGATGHLLVKRLLDRGHRVKAVVRSPDRLPVALRNHPSLSLVQTTLLDLSDDEMIDLVTGCTAIASCLGHNMSLRGIYGSPRKLVTEATRRLCRAVQEIRPTHPVRFVLMNTAGNRERNEPVSFAERGVVGLIRWLLPPHRDNEDAAEHLRTRIGPHSDAVEWVAVRPDTLVDERYVSDYDVYASPIRSAIFDPGKTSRINVADFMADLISNDATWNAWKGQMPVIYDRGSADEGR